MDFLTTKQFKKDITKAPKQVVTKFQEWATAVELLGLAETRKRPSFHDEPLTGKRLGQRSVRLNQQWRLIYCEHSKTLIDLEELTPHAY